MTRTVALAFLLTPWLSQPAGQTVLDHHVGTFPTDQQIDLHVPPSTFLLEWTRARVAFSTQLLMGFEIVPTPREQKPVTVARVITGMSVTQALDAVLDAVPEYEWTQ